MDRHDPWFWAGIAVGFVGGCVLVFSQCPWHSCIVRSFQPGPDNNALIDFRRP